MIIEYGPEPLADLEALAHILGRSRDTIRKHLTPVKRHNRWPYPSLYRVYGSDTVLNAVPQRKRVA